MQLVVGLGNPGPEYAGTRHNVGWWVVDRLASRWPARSGERRPEYRSWNARWRGRPVALMEPLTWMNLSGDAVATWRDRHGLDPDELLVIADDVYLPAGHLRLRPEGSSGGHRGLESIERALGTTQYARLRIGVGGVDAAGLRRHVLESPEGDEREALERAAEQAVEVVACWAGEGVLEAMNRFNRKARKEVLEP